MKKEWLALFEELHPTTAPERKDKAGSRNTSDAILNWSTEPYVLCDLFECICILFTKYRMSFHLDKRKLFKDRFEYAGHAITPEGNIPASRNYDLVQD
jgi:hypothetical protein